MNAQAQNALAPADVPRRVARNTVVQLVGKVLNGLVWLATLMILTRYLGTEGVGDYLLVLAFLAFLNVGDMGVYTIAVRELSSGEGRPGALLGNVFLIQVVLAVLAMVLASGAALLLSYSAEVTLAISLGALSYLFIAIGSSSMGATFAANLRMEFQALANIVRSLVFISLVGLIVSQGLGLIALVLAYDASILTKNALVILFSRKFTVPSFRFEPQLCRRLLVAALPLGIANMAWLAYNRIDMVMLSKMKTAEALGLYGLVYRFVELAWPVSFLFVVSVYPLLSRYYRSGDGERFRRLLQRSLDILSLLAIGLATGLIVFAEPIISFVASDEFLPAATSLRILSLAIVLIWLGNLIYHALFAIGKQAAAAWAALLGLVVNVGLNLILIPRFGFNGAAAATVVTESVVFVPLLIIVVRHLDHPLSFGAPAKIVAVALAAGATALLLEPNGIVLQGTAMAFIFGIGLALTRVVSIDDIRALRGALVERSMV
jgi:O-antigen/teichoic acid export membrane protein